MFEAASVGCVVVVGSVSIVVDGISDDVVVGISVVDGISDDVVVGISVVDVEVLSSTQISGPTNDPWTPM